VPVESYEGDYSAEPAGEGTVIEEETTDIPIAPLEDSTSLKNTSGSLLVTLPADAKLFVNGKETVSKGNTRQFASKGLTPGYRYPYSLKAVLNVDGQEVVRTRQVSLRAGETNQLAFDFNTPVETNLTVYLPRNARLELAGSQTSTTGAKRKFTTKKLSEGQVWSDYRVVVSIDRDGRTITKEQTIELRGGESRTLTFDVDSEQVASR
jgi:uncharacterized protein (TIGR03000 family)